MALTNAERQKRHRERQKAKLAAPTPMYLTAEQISDRDAVMSDRIYLDTLAEDLARRQKPHFMGWSCCYWAEAPLELIDHFGMREAWDGWQAEKQAMQAQLDASHARRKAEANRIIKEHGKEVCDRATAGGGYSTLFREYAKDPTLSAFKTTRRRA